jgi:hypothetical protein
MHTATYRRWVEMHRRCLPGFLHHHRYYDRGIAVCKRWDSFENFLADMGECHDGLTLDRKNNDRGYMKSNCRWATRKEQVWNSTRTTLILFRGKLQSIRAWAKELGINRGTMLKGL